MLAILHSLGMFIVDLFKPPCRLEAENLFLRHQLRIALRRAPPRLRLRNADRVLLICPVCLTVQVKERTCGRERCAPTSIDCAAPEGARNSHRARRCEPCKGAVGHGCRNCVAVFLSSYNAVTDVALFKAALWKRKCRGLRLAQRAGSMPSAGIVLQ
jgi:hypothetical protein